MNASPPLHPTDQMLLAYGLGKLVDPEASAVDSHLEVCDACRQRVSALSGDSFLDRVRDAGARPDTPAPGAAPSGRVKQADGPSHAGPGPSPDPALAGSLPPELADNPQYQVLRELGRGGMGVVYLARNTLMDRLEVLKVLNKEMLERKGTYDRFLREVRAAARLNHPHVVKAYSALQMGRLLVFAMEYVEGADLSQLVKTQGPLPVAHACSFIAQAALGLQHAHERGMVHRDIKPANLMLTRQGQRGIVKILDFGLARATSENSIDGGLTREGEMLGAPDYIAPEQTLESQTADIRADIYNLGCTLYYLLTGGPPFHGTSLYEILQAHHSTEARPLNLVRPEVPAELAAVVAKMMAKEREWRYQTPAEVAEALKPFFKPAKARSGSGDGEPSQPAQPGVDQPAPGVLPAGPELVAASGVSCSASAAAPAPGKAEKPNSPTVMWESLIAIPEPEHLSEPKSAVCPAKLDRPRPSWLRRALVGVVAGGLAALFVAGVLRVKSRDGRPGIDGVPEQAELLVDGAKVTERGPGGGRPLEVTVPAGERGVAVRKDGYRTFGDEVSVTTGEKTVVSERLVRPIEPGAGPPHLNLPNARELRPDDSAGSAQPEPPLPAEAAKAARTSDAVALVPGPGEVGPKPAPMPGPQAYPWPQAETAGGLRVAPNGRLIAMSRDGRLLAQIIPPKKMFRIVRSTDVSNPAETEQTPGLWGAAFSPNGKYLASHGDDKCIRFWDITTGKEVHQIPQADRVVRVAFSPNGTWLAAVIHNGRKINVWNVTTGVLQQAFTGHSDWPWSASFSPDGGLLATCSGPWDEKVQSPGEVKVWELQTGACANLAGHSMRASDVAFSPNGRYLASASFDKTAKIWDLRTLRCVTTFDKHPVYVTGVRFSPDGRLVASRGREKIVRVWEATTGREIATLMGLPGDPGMVEFSPDGRWIFAGTGNTLKAWEAPPSPPDSRPVPATTRRPRRGSAR